MKKPLPLAVALLLSSSNALAEPCDPPRIMVVMDGSSSMLNSITEQGVEIVKWDAARSAVLSVTESWPDAAQFGLMVFPGPAGGCSTGTVLVDIAPSTGPDIQAELASLDMTGTRQTPAGQTLMAAARNPGITAAGKRNYVVFVTDGFQFCSIDQPDGPPVCASSSDCSLMGVAKCPTCDACNTQSTLPACAGYADGCFCVQKWPILGVEALASAGVQTFVVGFGSNVDAKTLNAAAEKGGTAKAGCDPTSDSPSCFYNATLPSELNAALAAIVQKVASESCTGECGVEGTRTCAASGWSECVTPPEIECTGPCGAKGKQRCVQGALTTCDAVCDDADAGAAGSSGAAGSGSSNGAAGSAASSGVAGSGSSSGAAASSGAAGSSAAAGASGEAGDEGAATGESFLSGPDTGDEGGCGCRAANRSSGFPGVIALGLGLVAALASRARRP